ncbi:hypothetical protein LZ30DRAFT_378893 [Colletotrichum cereale]|nr:hypothetical protein LZ30DRAFT_378893 [Colletotrichum cereale]
MALSPMCMLPKLLRHSILPPQNHAGPLPPCPLRQPCASPTPARQASPMRPSAATETTMTSAALLLTDALWCFHRVLPAHTQPRDQVP